MIRDQLLSLWPDEDAVAACIKHEAETVDEAVFLAAHQPMRFIRINQGAKRGTERTLTEGDLLEEFLQPKLPEGRIILPIEGSSGVGKSHVIRWLDAQLGRRADRDQRHIVRVPKGMSLKGVLRLLLDGLQGAVYDELRGQLRSAREKLEPELAAKHLILNISHRLEQLGKAAAERIRDGMGSADDKFLKSYGDKRALPALINDSDLLHSHWLTREADGSKGVMARLAEQVTENALGPEDTRLHQVRSEDLELPRDLVERLNRTSQRFYEALRSGSGERLADAARLINRVLDPAKQDLLQLGDGSLTDLFRAVREQLLRDGKELVLLVEDFAVLSGIQGALLQVMITEAYRDGEQVLCTMRSALAYTEGVAHVPETVRTRARSLWRIEEQPGEGDDIHERVVELVGAYLNAARIGQQGLREAFAAEHREERWVPLVDGDDLEDETKEVLAAFGASRAGFPLFPFNREAIRQLTEQGSRKDGVLVFNPRNIINNVLNRVLVERQEFERGRFPRAGFAEDLRSAEVTSTVVRIIPALGARERALTLLACWGDQPGTLEEAAQLPRAVYSAFDIPPPGWGIVSQPVIERRVVLADADHDHHDHGVLASTPKVDSREKQWRDALESWGAGQLLTQVQARSLRKWLAQAMLDFVPWSMLPLKTQDGADYLKNHVYIPRSRGQGGVEPGDAFLVVANESDLEDSEARAGIIRSLMAFVRLHELEGSWTHEGAVLDAALCASFLEARAERAEAFLRSHHFRASSDTIPALTEALLIGARALGVQGAESRQLSARVSALFGDAEAPSAPATTMWSRNLDRLAKHRPALQAWLLEQIGARQGRGAVHAVDVTAIEPTVRETANSWTMTHQLPDVASNRDLKAAATALREVSKELPKALQKQREELLAWHAKAAAWFGEEPDKQELRETLRATINDARRDLPLRYDYDTLRRHVAALKNVSLKTTLADCVRLDKSDEPGDVLAVLARKPEAVVRATEELMREFDGFLAFYAREVSSRLEQQGENPVGNSTTAMRREIGKLRSLFQAIEEARS